MKPDAIEVNVEPVIGILAQTYFGKLGGKVQKDIDQCYISASYVKYLESAGARIIPVLTNQSDDYYEMIFENTNGVLFPGGGQNLINSTYTYSAEFFIRKSKMAYEQGDIYPIWGTCLGFEQMVVSIAQECILKPCQAKDKMSTLIPNWYWPHSEYIL